MAAPLTTARLRHRVEIRRSTQTPNGSGGYTTTWPVIATVMVEATGLDGKEAVLERVLEGISTYRFRLRYRAGFELKGSDQVRFGGTDLNIRGPASDPTGRREELTFLADTQSAQATA